MDPFACAVASAVLVACTPSTVSRTSRDGGNRDAPQVPNDQVHANESARGSAIPSARPLATELERLKRALDAQDADKLEQLLSPEGVWCGDYLYSPREFAVLVRKKDGALRPWLFGDPRRNEKSIRTYLETGVQTFQELSPTHRSMSFSIGENSLRVGFTLRSGRWLITDGLFCE